MTENAIVSLEEPIQAYLSSRQQEELLNSSRMYLRKNQIPLSAVTLRQAMGVLGDAAERSLQISKRAIINPKKDYLLWLKMVWN